MYHQHDCVCSMKRYKHNIDFDELNDEFSTSLTNVVPTPHMASQNFMHFRTSHKSFEDGTCLPNIHANYCHLHFMKIFINFCFEDVDTKLVPLYKYSHRYACDLGLCINNYASWMLYKTNFQI